MMDQGLVQIRYSRKVEDISAIESQGHIPFEIPYQEREAMASFQIPIPMSSHTPIQIQVPIPFQALEISVVTRRRDIPKEEIPSTMWEKMSDLIKSMDTLGWGKMSKIPEKKD